MIFKKLYISINCQNFSISLQTKSLNCCMCRTRYLPFGLEIGLDRKRSQITSFELYMTGLKSYFIFLTKV